MEADTNDSVEEKYLLIAKADNVKHISSLLKAVNFKDVSNLLHWLFFHNKRRLERFNELNEI